MAVPVSNIFSCKVVHLTSVHPALDSRILYKEGRTLAESGCRVVLIAPHDRDEAVAGVRIRAVPPAGNRRERMTRTALRVYRAALEEGAALYHLHDPELIPAGLLLKLRGKRVIYDAHEDLPRQTLIKEWLPARFRPMTAMAAGWLEALGAAFFDGIVGATPVISRRFPREKTITVRNYPILEELAWPESPAYRRRSPVIAYVGALSEYRGLGQMIQAVARVPDSLDARLVLAGRFSPAELEEDARRLPGWSKTEYLGWQSRTGVARLLSQARLGLVLLHPRPNYIDSLPVKLFEYLAAGLPVVASDFPGWREIVEKNRCGFLVDPLDPQAVAQAITRLLENPLEAEAMGRRGREAAVNKYNWKEEGEKLTAFYLSLLPR